MSRKQYVVMWTSRPNHLASTTEDYAKIFSPGRIVDQVIISRPGYADVVAGGVLARQNNAITFEGISEWFHLNHWTLRRVYLPFAVTYNKETRTITYTYLGR